MKMEAGSDTTASTLLNFILALTKYPRVLKQAQEEIDKACGNGRSPTVEDLDNLPYLSACVSEVQYIALFHLNHSNIIMIGFQMETNSSRRYSPCSDPG